MITFQEIIKRLNLFWEKQGCLIQHGYDLEVGAGTFNPHTFLRCLGPEPYKSAYIEPVRRPTDGRYGENPNRVQHFFQYQVVLKPSPIDIQDLYLQSLEVMGFDLKAHDIRFVHDDWESPTIGAWGLGWEVWIDGMEVTQFTYFQAVANYNLEPITGEITYGLERLAMYLQKVNSIYDIKWNEEVSYGDLYKQNEIEWSHYNFDEASTKMWFDHFQDFEREAKQLIEKGLPIPAYDFVMQASHAFNILDARSAISVTERTGYISRIRSLARLIATAYTESREAQNYPLKKSFQKEKETKVPTAEKTVPPKLTLEEQTDFLLEIGSEELPATFVPIGCAQLKSCMEALLKKHEISYHSLRTFGTPRRLAILIENLSSGKPSKLLEKKGPSLSQAFDTSGTLQPAGKGFFRSLNLPEMSLEQLQDNHPQIEIRTFKGNEYLFAKVKTAPLSTYTLFQEQLPKLILNLNFPKKMRWSDLEISFARPIRWLVALFNGEVLPFQLGPLSSSNISYGHPQLCPKKILLQNPKEYLNQLKEHFVLADCEERKAEIVKQLNALEPTLKAKIIEQERVLPQVTHITEWPLVTHANFDPTFLKAPKEVLISEMIEHQKYFPVADDKGTLQNSFVIVANNTPNDQIREGNQRVLSARLSDGVFLYEQDLKSTLTQFNEKLKTVTFQKDLGTIFEKVERIVNHTELLLNYIPVPNPANTLRAALLCKADLASLMVYEFPELQGVMGSYYAQAQGESEEVIDAISQHWLPRGEGDPLPKEGTSTLISLADKLDNLLGCFHVGLKPTSSSDPYALRRQALGLIKIVIQGKHHLPLKEILSSCQKNFPSADKSEAAEEVRAFLINRIKTVFLDYGFQKDEIAASITQDLNDIYSTYCKVKALRNFRKSSTQFPKLYEVYKRAKGQLSGQKTFSFSSSLLLEPAEIELNSLLNSLQEEYNQAVSNQHYNQAYSMLAKIQPALALLFDNVKILADDPKIQQNRIALLQRVFSLFSKLLDFSKIQEKS